VAADPSAVPALAFYGPGQAPGSLGEYFPPFAWSRPGALLARPQTAWVCQGQPSSGEGALYPVNATGFAEGYAASYANALNRADVPGTLPADFTVTPYFWNSPSLPHPATTSLPTIFDAIHSGLPIVTSDFLAVHIGSDNSFAGIANTADIIAGRHWFPDYAVRFYLSPDEKVSAGQVAACATLKAGGIDALVVGNEADATKAAVAMLIADYFGFTP
jgi:hypothetical protein